jgi:hypothetical protein
VGVISGVAALILYFVPAVQVRRISGNPVRFSGNGRGHGGLASGNLKLCASYVMPVLLGSRWFLVGMEK